MADGTTIEWARHPVTGRGASWNPLLAKLPTGKLGYHCEHASPGCENCYAEAFNLRRLPGRGTGLPFKPGHRPDVEIVLEPKQLLLPLSWKEPRGIFVCSMTDLFGRFVPNHLIDTMFAVMALCPQHVFFVLTKRAERANHYTNGSRNLWVGTAVHREMRRIRPGSPAKPPAWPLPNVWLGVSVEDQRRAEERIPHLLSARAAVRWISAEPLLEGIDLGNIPARDMSGEAFAHLNLLHRDGPGRFGKDGRRINDVPQLDWLVAGGESGHGARPSHPQWFRDLRDQCYSAGIPFFFKQWGEFGPAFRADLSPTTDPWSGADQRAVAEGRATVEQATRKMGKKRAGRALDGLEYNAMPGSAP